MSNATILCVDDEINVLHTLRDQLLRHFPDHTIEIAESGAEALVLVEEILAEGKEVPLIIADQIMPEMKGDELLIELHARYPHILQVMLTGQATAEDVGNAVNRGNLYRFMTKPWSDLDLQLTIAEALRCYQQEQQIRQQQAALDRAYRELEVLNAELEQQVQDRTQQLQQNEYQLRLFIEHTPAAVAMFDREMRYILASHRWKTEYALEEQEITGRSHYEVFPKLPDRWNAIYQRCLAGTVERCEEDCFVQEDGSVTWISWEIHPWYTEPGEIGGIIIFTQVITDRKLTEIALRESEQRHATLAEVSPVGVFRTNLSGDLIYTNDRWCEITGLTHADAQQEGWLQAIHPDWRDRLPAHWQWTDTSQNSFFETCLVHPDGSIHWVYCQSLPEYNEAGKPIGLVGTLTDITQLKQAEASLLETQRLAHIGSWSFNLETQEIIWSEELYRMFGLDPAQPVPAYVEYLEKIHPEDRSRLLQCVERAAQQGTSYSLDYRAIHTDGSIRYHEGRGEAIRNVQGQVVKLHGTALDITDRKRAEAKIQQSEELLQLTLNFTGIGTWNWQPSTGEYVWNGKMEELLDLPPGLNDMFQIWNERIHREDVERVTASVQNALANGSTFAEEYRYHLLDGRTVWRWVKGQGVYTETGEVERMLGVLQDITDRKRAEVQLEAQNVLLEQIAKGEPLSDILQAFIAQIEQQLAGASCSVMFVDGERLHCGPAQNLPKGYLQAVDGVPIAEGSGSCGTAAFRNQPVIVSDIASDSLWANYKDLALNYGLQACWSIPIVASDDQVLGTFAVYHSEVRSPQPYELETILQMANIAGIAIERDQAEATLRESERRYATLTEVAPVGIFRFNLAGDCVYVNHHWSAMTGRPAEASLGQGWIDGIHPDDREWLITGWLRAKEQGGIHHSEGRHLHPNGTTTWFYAQILPETDADGVITGYVGALTDITDRKQIEDSLRQSEAKQSALISALPDLIMRVNRDGLYLDFFTTSSFKVLGDRETVIGAHVGVSLPPALAQKRLNAIRTALQTGEVQVYEQEIWVEGERQTEECRVVVCGKDEVLIIGRDITDRKRAEAALQQSEERRRLALDLTEIGSWEFELATGEAIWSDSHYRLMGLVPDEHPNHYESWRERVHPDDLVWVEQAFTQALDAQFLLDVEYRVVYPDGQVHWVLTKGQGIYDEDGQPLRMLGVMMDVSDRKHAELALQQLNEELEQRVQQRTQDLQQINAQLRDSEERFQTFMNNSPTAAWITDIDGMMVYVNQTYYRAFQVPTTDIIHKSLFELYPSELASKFLENTRSVAIASQALETMEACLRPDGSMGDFLVYKFPVSDSSGQHLVGGVAIDITDRKQAQETLQAEQLRLQLALEAAKMATWSCSLQTGSLIWSDRAQEIFGFVPGTFPGDRETFLAMVHPGDVDQVIQAIAHTFETGASYSIEYRIYRLDGEVRWIAVWGIIPPDLPIADRQLIGVVCDITDRKQAEQALRESEARYQTLAQISPVGIFRTDLEGNCIYANDRWCEIAGFTVEAAQQQGWVSGIHPADRDRIFAEWYQAARLNQLFKSEYRFQNVTTGLITWVLGQAIAEHNSDGTIVGYVGTITDITDRKQAEAALQESEERLRLALTATNQGLYDLNLKTGEAIVSPEYVTMLGYDPATFQETNAKWIERLHPDDIAEVAETYRAYVAGEISNYQVEFRQRTQSGQWKWVLSLGRIVAWDEAGAPLRMLGTHTDLDDRKRAEARLQEQEQFLRSIFENVENPIFVIDVLDDHNFQIVGWNPASERISNIPIADAVGKSVLEAVGTEVGSVMCTNYRRCIEQGSPITYEEFLSLPSGNLWTLTTLNPVKDLDGKVYRLVGTALNITERKQAEETLQRFNQELEQRVANRTIELQQAMEAAEAANRAKSSFLANMSHELRTPLNAILGFSQLLNRDNDLNGDQQEKVGVINRSGEHLLNLINDILAMSKIESGRITLTTKSFNLQSLLEDLTELFGLKAESKGLTLTTQIDPAVPQYIHTDESKLRQVLINLLSNAIKFTSDGEVILRVQNRAPESLIVASPLPLALYFEVEDTGCGIHPSEQTLVFEPFGQTQSGQQIQEGTGLGLPISRQFVQLMGGELNFASIPALGSSFYFTIPVDAVQASDIPSQFSQQRVIGLVETLPTYRLLVVEDNPENRQFLVQLLQSIGFEVQAATNGLEAVNLWQSWAPHLIWMDMRMPVMDGYTAAQRIRALEQSLTESGQAQTPTKILALTASAFEDERSAILAAGCDDFVFKPATEAMLFEKIAEYLGVCYIYQEQSANQPSRSSVMSDNLLAADVVEMMSRDWIQQLQRAARMADEDLMLELIDQIPSSHYELAEGLKGLVAELQLDKLIELTADQG